MNLLTTAAAPWLTKVSEWRASVRWHTKCPMAYKGARVASLGRSSIDSKGACTRPTVFVDMLAHCIAREELLQAFQGSNGAGRA